MTALPKHKMTFDEFLHWAAAQGGDVTNSCAVTSS